MYCNKHYCEIMIDETRKVDYCLLCHIEHNEKQIAYLAQTLEAVTKELKKVEEERDETLRILSEANNDFAIEREKWKKELQ